MFALRWTAIVTVVILPITYIIGILFLEDTNTEVNWKFPWLLYNIGALLSFVNSILLAFFEGCDSVKKVQIIRLKITVLSTIIILIGLILNFSLYALSISLLVSSIYGTLTLYYKYKKNIHIFYYKNKESYYDWGPEIFLLLRKYIVSWSSGFIIFQLFTPIMFHFHGAVEAGKIGISIAVFTAIFSVSNIWTTSIIPKINIAIAKSEFVKLNYIFNKHFILTICTYVLGSIVFYILFFIFHDKFDFFDRFLNIRSLTLLNLGWFAQLFIHNLAIYLRSHKEEPLLVPSVYSAIYVVSTTILSGFYLSIDFFFIGFVTLFLWFLPWVIILYKRKKRFNMSSINVQ
jgi:O-antigen/teichoic acid export membrane protein